MSDAAVLPSNRTYANVAGLIVLLLACGLRFVIEGIYHLPSPVGDSSYFISASVNYCRTGFLGTTAFQIDPTGQARMIWHGFVSPMLFSRMSYNCSATGLYITLWAVKALTSAAVIWTGLRRRQSLAIIAGLLAFAFAAQSVIAFRPESVGLLLIALAEVAFECEAPLLLGLLLGTLLCTQPTLAALHGLVLVIARFSWLWRRRMYFTLGYAAAVGVLFAWYPFPAVDLLKGIALQAKMIVARSDGNVLSYYLLVPFLPFWGGLLVVTWSIMISRNRMYLALAPFLWFFGPRLPPTYYNLMPICWTLMVLVCMRSSERTSQILGVASFSLATLGLATLSARDVLTIEAYADTFRATHNQIAQLAQSGAIIGEVPAFVSLTNPSLGVTDPSVIRLPANSSGTRTYALYAVNGRPHSPCGEISPEPRVSLSVGQFTPFKSNSGWMTYVCRSP